MSSFLLFDFFYVRYFYLQYALLRTYVTTYSNFEPLPWQEEERSYPQTVQYGTLGTHTPSEMTRDSIYDFSTMRPPSSRGGRRGGQASSAHSDDDNMSFISRLGSASVISRPYTSTMSVSSRTSFRAYKSGRHDVNPEMIKQLEDEINTLLEETILLKREGKVTEALHKAQEAVKKEQIMRKCDNSKEELLFPTLFNLGAAYEANGMPEKAIKTYYVFLKKQRGHALSGQLRITMGNVYYGLHDYSSAIKCYEMALDQLTNDEQTIRSKVKRNIGNSFFRSGKLLQAMKHYEEVVNSTPDSDYQACYNLFLCRYAMGDKDRMKNDFTLLVDIRANVIDVDDDLASQALSAPIDDEDDLSKEDEQLLVAAKLVTQTPDGTADPDLYDWVIGVLDEENMDHIVNLLELEKGNKLLKRKEINAATNILEGLQQKDDKVRAASTANLSCLSFLGGDSTKASEYADIALEADRYSGKALVNKGNCFFIEGDFVSAKEMYLEAIGVENDCFQAIFNLGLVNVQLGLAEEAIQAFEELHRLTPNNPEVIYQIADIYDLQGRSAEAIRWFSVLMARVPNDPNVLSRLSQLHLHTSEDTQEALHYQLESFRNYPVDLDVLSWLGSHFVKNELFEKSIHFFRHAQLVQPNEVKWGMMTASALRRVDDDEGALREYEALYQRFPDNTECQQNITALRQKLQLDV